MVNVFIFREQQLKKLKDMQRAFDEFVKDVENEKIVIVEASYQSEINADTIENPAYDRITMDIEYSKAY